MATISLPNFFGSGGNLIQDFLNTIEGKWGIYGQDGLPFTGFGLTLLGAIQSTYSFAYNKVTRISNFPLERGGFADYNKVEMPGQAAVTLCLTGNESDRTHFLNSIDAACKSTKLYSVITPEVQYMNYSMVEYNYSRSARQGTTLLAVQILMEEIRQVSLQTTTIPNNSIPSPKNPADSASKSSGKVQGTTFDPAIQNGITKGLGG